MATVDLVHLSVVKDDVSILRNVELSVADGELVAIVGPSGSGKTSLLRAVAGLDGLSSGFVAIGGVRLHKGDRPDVAMVFQQNVLFPNMDVEGNVSFPLEVRGLPRDEVRNRVTAEGRALHIEELMKRRPQELSAGHQQLVQIARALVRAPQVFLMDEPLARLDPWLKSRMRGELKLLQRGYGVTTLYVTNDPVEAMAVADRIAVMNRGSIAQVAAPEVVYHEPVSLLVAVVMGELALLDVRIEGDSQGSWIVHPEFRLRAWAPQLRDHHGGGLRMGLRPDYVEVGDPRDATVSVRRIDHLGGGQVAVASLGAEEITMRWRASGGVGDDVGIKIVRYQLFDPATGAIVAS